jgi:hypothetical protein
LEVTSPCEPLKNQAVFRVTPMSACTGNRVTITSNQQKSNRDAATHGVRVRTRRVRLLDEQIRLGTGKPGEGNPELNFNPKSALCASHANARFNLGVCREDNALALSDGPHDSQKAGGIACCKQLLRIGPALVRATQSERHRHSQVQRPVGRHRSGIGAGCCSHLGVIENLLDQHLMPSFCGSLAFGHSLRSGTLRIARPAVISAMFNFCSKSVCLFIRATGGR